MRATWKDRSLATVIALQELEKNANDEMALAKAFGQTAVADEIKDALPLFAALRADVYQNRNKYLKDPAATRGSTTVPATVATPASMPALATNRKPLSIMFSNQISEAVSKVTFRVGQVQSGDGEGGEFQEVSREGGLLIGLRCGVARFTSTINIVVAVQPVFLSVNGVKAGQWYGKSGALQVIDLIAKDGYAVGAFSVGDLAGHPELRLKFMRIGDGFLDPNDSYFSPYIGDETFVRSDRNLDDLGTKPLPAVIGISGKANVAKNTLGLGLVFMPPPAVPTPEPATRAAIPAAPVSPEEVLNPLPISVDIGTPIKKLLDSKTYQ
jgi:hypothetical protein